MTGLVDYSGRSTEGRDKVSYRFNGSNANEGTVEVVCFKPYISVDDPRKAVFTHHCKWTLSEDGKTVTVKQINGGSGSISFPVNEQRMPSIPPSTDQYCAFAGGEVVEEDDEDCDGDG